jgi:membrane protease YdiL (CAAX protease family)
LPAVLLTVAAFAASVFVIALFAEESVLASVGIGEALGVGLVGTLAARRVPGPQAERLGLQGFASRFVVPLLLLLPCVLVVSEIDNLMVALLPPPEALEGAEELAARVDTESLYGRLQLALIAVGIAPVVEEWFFRGVIQQGLVAHRGRLRGVFFTALLFAPLHTFSASGGSSLASALVVSTCVGMVLGTVRLATGSILACILLNAGINALGLGASWAEEVVPIPGFNAPGSHTPLLFLLPSLACSGWGLWRFVVHAQQAPVAIPVAEPESDESEDGWHF